VSTGYVQSWNTGKSFLSCFAFSPALSRLRGLLPLPRKRALVGRREKGGESEREWRGDLAAVGGSAVSSASDFATDATARKKRGRRCHVAADGPKTY